MRRLPADEPGVFDASPSAWLRRYVHRYTAFTEPARLARLRPEGNGLPDGSDPSKPAGGGRA